MVAVWVGSAADRGTSHGPRLRAGMKGQCSVDGGGGGSRTNIPKRLTRIVLRSFTGVCGEGGSLLRFLLAAAETTRRRLAAAASPTCCRRQLGGQIPEGERHRQLSLCTSHLTGSGFLLQTGRRRISWNPETHVTFLQAGTRRDEFANLDEDRTSA